MDVEQILTWSISSLVSPTPYVLHSYTTDYLSAVYMSVYVCTHSGQTGVCLTLTCMYVLCVIVYDALHTPY